LNSVTG